MSKAVAVGERALVLGFKGVGFEVIAAEDGESLARELALLARMPDVGLVLVTESLAGEAPEALEHFREVSSAILTTVPTQRGSQHRSFNEMRNLIERAVGVDMLGKETDAKGGSQAT